MRICEYGCGQEAIYKMTSGKMCCSDFYSKCPSVIEKIKNKNIGRKDSSETRMKKRISRTGKKNKKPVLLKNNKTIVCSYGCNKLAKYYFSISKKYCCEDHISKCPIERQKKSERMKGYKVSKKTKDKISKKIILLNIQNENYRINQSLTRKLTISDYQQRYPFFSKIEELRINPNKPNKKEIQVHCKNHKCLNSKEQNGWFTPTNIQLYERIRQLESKDGQGGCYFYCSQKCKNECPLFNLYSDPFKVNKKIYTQEEYQQFRNFVLERDEYICQFCGDPAEYVHHERPQKLEPVFSLDPDFAWGLL